MDTQQILDVIILFTTMCSCAKDATGDKISSQGLAVSIQDLANNGLRTEAMQEIMDTHVFNITSVDGEFLLKKISQRIADRFSHTYDAVKRIKSAVEGEYNTTAFTSECPYPECCMVKSDSLEYAPNFNAEVNSNGLCYRISQDAKSQPTLSGSEAVLDAMRENYYLNNQLKWQYFGSEEGVHTFYPSKATADCDAYDGRFRPWYVETVTPLPKDIVVVIDKSTSMESSLMDIAKNAATVVLDTLNPNDRVGVVAFSGTAQTPPGRLDACYSHQMAFATPDNIRYLKEFINGLTGYGDTKYLSALNKAFGLFSGKHPANDCRERTKAILFLTDGEQRGSNADQILERINTLNGEMNNTVKILTYGLGTKINENAYRLLHNMSTEIGQEIRWLDPLWMPSVSTAT